MSSWWNNTVIYEICLASFKDDNDDGFGDLKGLTSVLDYFECLKVDSLLLSPLQPSLNNSSYAITNYTNVDPRYGTLKDFDIFMREAKLKGLNVLMDLIVSHTSDQHTWFLKSVMREGIYKDYYIWSNPVIFGERVLPPDDHLSVCGGSAWEYNQQRRQFYLHQFSSKQPNLNWQNPNVRKKIEDIMLFWLRKGVDGFRMDQASHFIGKFVSAGTQIIDEKWDMFLWCIPEKVVRENIKCMKEWKDFLTEYKMGKDKILLTTACVCPPTRNLSVYYGNSEHDVVDVPFNMHLLSLASSLTARDLHRIIVDRIKAVPYGKTPSWMLGTRYHSRPVSRIGSDLIKGIHMVSALLPGVLFCYYGDELGMEDFSDKDTESDASLNENVRIDNVSPMQWNSGKFAGFTSEAKPWHPVHENFKTLNVQHSQSNRFSNFNIFCQLLQFRKEPAIKCGNIQFPVLDGNIFSMIRVLPEKKSFLVALNFGKCLTFIDFCNASSYIPEIGYLELADNKMYFDRLCGRKSSNSENISEAYMKVFDLCTTSSKGREVLLNNIIMLPRTAIVISFLAKKSLSLSLY